MSNINNLIVAFIFISQLFLVNSQNCASLVYVDSLSLLPENFFSPYFLDKESSLPYSGFAYRSSQNTFDSLNLQNGLYHGYQRYYTKNSKTSKYKLYAISYYDIPNHMYLQLFWNKIETRMRGQFIFEYNGNKVLINCKYSNRLKKFKLTLIENKRLNTKKSTDKRIVTFTDYFDFIQYLRGFSLDMSTLSEFFLLCSPHFLGHDN